MKKLYRSRSDCKVCGLCGGLAEMLNVDSTLLRLVLIITACFSGGTVILLYVLACFVIPKEPLLNDPMTAYGQRTYTGPGSSKSCSHEETSHSKLDDMMKDIEKKAMRQEIEQLRARLNKYEKGEV